MMSNLQRVFAMLFPFDYPLCVQKAERKGRTQAEIDRVICWLTGYTQTGLVVQLKQGPADEEDPRARHTNWPRA